MNFRFSFSMSVIACALVFTGCSTPDSRIKKDQAAFESLPPAEQAKIREGKVDVGFTPVMVRMALGEPPRIYTRTTQKGNEEIWAYQENGPAVSFGFGIGGGSRGTGGGVGVGVGTGDRRGDKIRIVFDSGIVSAIESVHR